MVLHRGTRAGRSVYEALNDADKDMKAIMVSLYNDLIPCKEVVKVGYVGNRKRCLVSCLFIFLCEHVGLFSFHFSFLPNFLIRTRRTQSR